MFVIASVMHEDTRVAEAAEASFLEILADVRLVIPSEKRERDGELVSQHITNGRKIALYQKKRACSLLAADHRFFLPDGAPDVRRGSKGTFCLHLGGATSRRIFLRDVLGVVVDASVHLVVRLAFQIFVYFLCALENRSSVLIQLRVNLDRGGRSLI